MRHSVLWAAVAVMVGTPARMAAAQTAARPADEAEVLNPTVLLTTCNS